MAGNDADAPRRSKRQRKKPPLIEEDEALRAAAGELETEASAVSEEEPAGKKKKKQTAVAANPNFDNTRAMRKLMGETWNAIEKCGFDEWLEDKEAADRQYKIENNSYAKRLTQANRIVNGKDITHYQTHGDCQELKRLSDERLSAIIDPLTKWAKMALCYSLGLKISGGAEGAEAIKQFIRTGSRSDISAGCNGSKNHFQTSPCTTLETLFLSPDHLRLKGKVEIAKHKIVIAETEGDEGDSNLQLLCDTMGGRAGKSIPRMMNELINANFLIGPKDHPFLTSDKEKTHSSLYERKKLELIHPDITGPGYQIPDGTCKLKRFL